MIAAPLLRADWPVPSGVHALTTLRGIEGDGASSAPFEYFNLGAHCGDDPHAVASNRARLQVLAGVPSQPHWLRQVHGVEVARIGARTAESNDSEPNEDAELQQADAAVTVVPGAVLAILTADCLPVLFCGADGREVGAAHAGWRSLAAGVLERTVAAMATPAAEILAWLGPAAGPRAYEIGTDVHAAFIAHNPNASEAFVSTRPGHWHIDLFALAHQRLQACGVHRIFGGGLCTISDARRFFSHRRDGRSGRMASLIWIDASA